MKFILSLSLILSLFASQTVHAGFGGPPFTAAVPGTYAADCSNNPCDTTKNLYCSSSAIPNDNNAQSCRCVSGSYFNSVLSQDSCVPCPPGFYCIPSFVGSFSPTGPIPCPSGEISYYGASSCVATTTSGICPKQCTTPTPIK
jgi:hypothetical protein